MNLPEGKRQTPDVAVVDDKTKAYLSNLGYKNIEVPPGMNLQQDAVNEPSQSVDDRVEPIANDAVVGDTISLNAGTVIDIPEKKSGSRSPVYAVEQKKKIEEDVIEAKNNNVVDSGSSGSNKVDGSQNNQDGQKSNKEVQSLLDKVRADKDKEIDELKRNNEMTQVQIQTMMQMMQAQKGKKDEGSVKKKADSPKLKNYINDLGDEWDSGEALNMSTKSGQVYSSYMEARDEWLLERAESGVEERLTKRQQDGLVMKKAEEFSKNNPEYQNYDGSPNISKIMNFFEEIKNGDWNKLKNAMDVISKGDVIINSNPIVDNANIQINDKANKVNVQAIGNTGSSAGSVDNQVKQEPKAIKTLRRLYGSNFEIPDGITIID